ncbi:hypothetical protein CHS0354_003366 [Potamilus streckersoni]|uniref:Uncharacterized protein n=1 Tax=Potamilus streckersoni TaxID=2493646 RepID=A0AAE0SUU6_9BIVA|nr:hypothetical protein CHS0354_003366 [Potamilus streckersoni]
MLEGDIIVPTAHADQYTRSYQTEEEESYRGPFHHAEKKNRTLSARHRSAKEDENMMKKMNKSITRVRFYEMDTQKIIRHTETKESPGDDQNWLVISTEEEEGLICSRNFELSDDYWIIISHNEDNVATHKDRLYYYPEVDKMPLCHQDDLPDSPVSTFGRNVSVTNSSYNSTSIRLAEPFTERRASSTKMPTKVISQATQMESGPRSRLPSLSFYYESEYDDWIIITGQEVEKLGASINKC